MNNIWLVTKDQLLSAELFEIHLFNENVPADGWIIRIGDDARKGRIMQKI
jgi:hypothetical protein